MYFFELEWNSHSPQQTLRPHVLGWDRRLLQQLCTFVAPSEQAFQSIHSKILDNAKDCIWYNYMWSFEKERICFKGRAMKRGKEGEINRALSSRSLCKWSQQPGQSEAEAWNSIRVSHMDGETLRIWPIFCSFLWCIGRGLHWKQSSWDSMWCSCGMMASLAVAEPTASQHWYIYVGY